MQCKVRPVSLKPPKTKDKQETLDARKEKQVTLHIKNQDDFGLLREVREALLTMMMEGSSSEVFFQPIETIRYLRICPILLD